MTVQKFKTFLNEEGRSRGEAMEDVIVSAVNGKPKGSDKFDIEAEAGVRVAEFLKKNGVKGNAKVLGADQIEVTPEWAKYWPDGKVPPTTKTPKTDFMVGSAKISLKSGSAAQLMSGGRNESLATFYTALEKTSAIEEKMANKLDVMLEGLAPASTAKSDLRTAIKDQTDELVNKANEAHKLLMSELKSIFESNKEFRNAFAYEAMSGEVKFGGNDGTCTHFLVTGFDGNNSSLHSVKDQKYVEKIAKQMKVSVRFKTTSVKKKIDGKNVKTGEYRYWSVVGLIIDKMQEDVDTMMNSGEVLSENIITDFFKKAWNKIKNAFKAAVAYVRKNVKNVFDFLGVVPDVTFKNNVKF